MLDGGYEFVLRALVLVSWLISRGASMQIFICIRGVFERVIVVKFN